jgi:hypothetical protein
MAVPRTCECGYEVEVEFEDHVCVVCGQECCPACELQHEGESYCYRCAESELDIASEIVEGDAQQTRRYLAFPCIKCNALVREDPARHPDLLCAECR